MVRKDIPLEDQMVQVGHACFESGREYGVKNTFLVLLQVRNEMELSEWSDILNKKNIQHHLFFECDPICSYGQSMGNTALCTEPIHGPLRDIFKNCKKYYV